MDPAPRRVWFLNLDADEELRHPGAVNPSAAMVDRCAQLATRLEGLVPPGDVWFTPGMSLPVARGLTGLAWSPTPHALRTLAKTGARVLDAPAWEALRAANHRSLSAGVGQSLPGAVFARSRAELDAALRAGACSGVWLLKRPWSYRGGGRLRVRGTSLDASGARWVEATLAREGGVQVEPEVARVEDHGLHGFLSREGEVTWGALTVQEVDAFGAWVRSKRADESLLRDDERARWELVKPRVVAGLRAVGYHGPFGVDAFRWRGDDGGVRYCAPCEVNARYSMGWAVGMAGRRVDLDGA